MNETKTNQPADLSTLIPICVLGGGVLIYTKMGGTDLKSFLSLALNVAWIGFGLVIAFVAIKFYFKHSPKTGEMGIEMGKTIPTSSWIPRLKFFLPIGKLRHLLVTGLTGSGKSTFIRRFVQQILKKGLSFMYVDFKGEQSDYDELMQICKQEGIEENEIQIFDMSEPEKCFTCNPLMILKDRLETVGFIKSIFFEEDTNPYYVHQAEQFLNSCLQLMDEAGVPRTFKRIQEIYYDDRARLSMIATVKAKQRRGDLTQDFYLQYFDELFKQLSPKQRSERFSGFLSVLTLFTTEPISRIFNSEEDNQLQLASVFDLNKSVIIRVPGEAYGDFSRKIVESFVKIMPVLIARRRKIKDRKDYWLLLDEGCSYVGQTMVDLAKKAGSAGVKLLVTRMCDSDFESVEPGFLGKMLSAFDTFICFQTNEPETRETMAKLAMTHEIQKKTSRISQGSETGDGSLRDAREYRIQPTEFGRLGLGQAFVIAPRIGVFEKVQISQPDMLKEAA